MLGGNYLAASYQRKLDKIIEEEFISFNRDNEKKLKVFRQVGERSNSLKEAETKLNAQRTKVVVGSGAVGAISGAVVGSVLGPFGAVAGSWLGAAFGALLGNENL